MATATEAAAEAEGVPDRAHLYSYAVTPSP